MQADIQTYMGKVCHEHPTGSAATCARGVLSEPEGMLTGLKREEAFRSGPI